jgi:hypothetical protein
MVNQVHAFRHRDVVRVVKAARAAGVAVEQVTVNPHSGAITAGPAQGVVDGLGQPNSWDEVLIRDAEDTKRSS